MRSGLVLVLLLAGSASMAAAQAPGSPPYPPPPSRIEALPPPPAPPPQLVPSPPPAIPSGPEPQHQGDVTFVSGGVGDEDRSAMRAMAHDYNLHLQFAIAGSGEYLAGVNVTVTDEKGKTLLDTIADGPLFLAKLPPGRYKIAVAQGGGRSQSRTVVISAGAPVAQAFYWPAPS
jgi:hypothetical protein